MGDEPPVMGAGLPMPALSGAGVPALVQGAWAPSAGGAAIPLRARLRLPGLFGPQAPTPPQPAPSSVALEIHRQPLRLASDWQEDILQVCRREGAFGTPVLDHLRRTGLLTRCVFLSSDTPDGPLVFRYIGQPSIATLGREWAERNIGRPHVDNPLRALPDSLGAEYTELLEAGEPLHNLGIAHGLHAEPVRFTHVLYGWRAPDGRRAVLSAVQI